MSSVNDIHWIVGLFEGEGYFGYVDGPRISIAMVDLDVIERVRKIIGSYLKINTLNGITRPNNQQQYRVYFSGTLAIQWMMTLYSLMGIKRKAKIRECIHKWKNSIGTNQFTTENRDRLSLVKRLAKSKKISISEAREILAKQETIQ